MTGQADLVSAVTGLIGFAAAEEQRLLAVAPAGEEGDPACWAALPVVAHNSEFRAQQVHRLRAILAGGCLRRSRRSTTRRPRSTSATRRRNPGRHALIAGAPRAS